MTNEYNPDGKEIRFIDSHYKDLLTRFGLLLRKAVSQRFDFYQRNLQTFVSRN